MNTSYKILWLFLALVAGFFGGVLRGHELSVCYDAVTGLYAHDYSSVLLPAICAVCAAIFLGCAFTAKYSKIPYETRFSLSKSGAMLSVLAGIVIAVSGVINLLAAISVEFSIYKFLLGVFSFAAGFCAIRLSAVRKAAQPNENTKMYLVVMVFWAAFVLISTFMEHPVEPVLQVFAYDLLSGCAAALAMYCQAAQAFGKKRTRLGLFSSLLAVTLLTVTVFGRVCAVILSGDVWYVLEVLFRLTAMLGLLILCAQGAAAYLRTPPQTEEMSIEKE